MASFGELFPGVKKLTKESEEDAGGELFEAGPLDLDSGVAKFKLRPKTKAANADDDSDAE